MKLKTEATIHLATKIPGPLSTELQKRREASVPRGVASVLPIFVRRANGVTVEDVDGNRFLDFTGGIGCRMPDIANRKSSRRFRSNRSSSSIRVSW